MLLTYAIRLSREFRKSRIIFLSQDMAFVCITLTGVPEDIHRIILVERLIASQIRESDFDFKLCVISIARQVGIA